jgi:hypothetical protein
MIRGNHLRVALFFFQCLSFVRAPGRLVFRSGASCVAEGKRRAREYDIENPTATHIIVLKGVVGMLSFIATSSSHNILPPTNPPAVTRIAVLHATACLIV